MSAFDGSGTFVITGTGLPYVTNTLISSSVANTLNSDLAIGLSTCITKNGQTTPTANIPMGGFRVTGIGAATTTGDALSAGRPANVTTVTATGNIIGAGTLVIDSSITSTNGSVVSGNNVSAFGFNQTASLQGTQLLITELGGGAVTYDVVPRVNGVRLTDGATSWSAISERAQKKDLQPLPRDAFDVIGAHDIKLGRYVSEKGDAPLSPFLFYEDAAEHFPYATVYTPEKSWTNPKTGKVETRPEYKGISLEKYVPLLMAAFQQQIAINAQLTERIAALEAKK